MARQTVSTTSKPRCLRLSPSELQGLVNQERGTWRIFRIQQVREQAKREAQRVRDAVHLQERRMLDDLRQELELQWQAEKEKRVTHLEKEYQDSMKNIGQAHRQAEEQPDPDEVLQQQAEHYQRLAVLRGREAGKQQRDEVKQQQHLKKRLLKQRQDVLCLEKVRARHVANLPVPEACRRKRVKEKKLPPRVVFHEAGTFTTTHYVPQNIRIEKEVWSSKPSAKEKAEVEEASRAREEEAQHRQAEEERIKRDQRGREALRKEHLTRLLQHLTAGLDEAQHHHHLSHFLHGKDGSVWESEESQLKEQTHHQKRMEEAVEKLLHEEYERKEKEDEYLGINNFPEPTKQSSDYLEEIESSDVARETVSKTKVRSLRSLLKEVERRRNRILQDLEDSIPVRGPSRLREGGSPRDREGNIHLAETVPAHLHPGHPPITSLPNGTAPGLPPPSQPERRPVETQSDISEAPDSYSTILPLSEESVPVSGDSTQHSTSPSLPHRFSTPQEQQTEPRETLARQPGLSEFHRTTSEAYSLNSENIKINIDLDAGSSSLVASDSSLEHPQKQQTESYISSTEYCSLPSDIPRKMSLQEIEEDLQKIQKHRQRNQDLIDSLSRKFNSPGHHVPTTYLEKLKEDGSGKKPLTRKEKSELQKKALIKFYIQKLLQRGDQAGEISASTVEGSGVSISSLGSFLSFLEGERQEDQPTTSSSVYLASASTKSLSSYDENIDEFHARIKSRDGHLPPHTLPFTSTSSISSLPDSIHTDPHYTTTTCPCYHNTSNTISPSFASYTSSSSSFAPSTTSTKYTSQHVSKPHPESQGFSTASRSPKHELNSDYSLSTPVSTISYGTSIARSPQEIVGDEERRQKNITRPHSYLTTHREYESQTTTENPSARQADPCARLQWYGIQRQVTRVWQHTDTTTTSDDSPGGTTTKLSVFPQNKLSDFRVTETIPSIITQTSITSSDSSIGRVSELSKLSWTKMSDIGSSEPDKLFIPPATSTTTSITTTQTVSHSSGESTVSMPDMAEVLRKFGLGEDKSSSATPINEEEEEED